jgi:hypothetical protein
MGGPRTKRQRLRAIFFPSAGPRWLVPSAGTSKAPRSAFPKSPTTASMPALFVWMIAAVSPKRQTPPASGNLMRNCSSPVRCGSGRWIVGMMRRLRRRRRSCRLSIDRGGGSGRGWRSSGEWPSLWTPSSSGNGFPDSYSSPKYIFSHTCGYLFAMSFF